MNDDLIHLPGFAVDHYQISPNGTIEVRAHPLAPAADCPECGYSTSRVHSRYTRSLADLALADQPVRLKITVRRFVCQNAKCPRKLFAESLGQLAERRAQRTERLTHQLHAIGLANGGQSGMRLAHRLRLRTSASTLLRIVRQRASPPAPDPTIIGVDDWAWRKGWRYGTVIVDLQRRQPVVLLPDRRAATLAAWLQQHPNISHVVRDRLAHFGQGTRQGAPQAQQVLDRWHLIQNLRETSEQALSRLRMIRANTPVVSQGRTTAEDLASQAKRAARQQRYERVKALQRQGLSSRQIARELGMGRSTVLRFCRAAQYPERARLTQTPERLAPYLAQLQAAWDQGSRNAMQAWRQIRAAGFTGSRQIVARWFRARREQPSPSTPKRYLTPAFFQGRTLNREPEANPLASPRRIASLILRAPERLADGERLQLEQACQHAEVKRIRQLAQTFLEMTRQRQWRRLHKWLRDCEASGLPAFVSLAQSLRQDYPAVEAALRLALSNGPVEGQINRLKLLKRSMYGRAKLDLLQIRFLARV
jgi:transposase